jgi:DNA-binding CsgD family transcriptional regulator
MLADLYSAFPEIAREHQIVRDGARKVVEYEVVEGGDAVLDRVDELLASCTRQFDILTNLKGPQYISQLHIRRDRLSEQNRRLAALGVRQRSLISPELRDAPGMEAALRSDQASGEEFRVASGKLPPHTVIIDTRIALVSINPDHTALGAIVIAAAGVVQTLQAFFDLAWQDATPLLLSGQRAVDRRRAEILRLLAQGAKDETIARTLGVGVRTVRREVSDIQAELGAASRFHAGVLAMKRGLIPDG